MQGTNDACAPDLPLHVPLDRYKTNLQTIIRKIKEYNEDIKVLSITPPPVVEANLPLEQKGQRFDNLAEQYGKVVLDVVHEDSTLGVIDARVIVDASDKSREDLMLYV